MVTIREVARRAGVSIMTVSKVMNDAPDVSVATKERIRELARQMGYRTNPIARGLRLRTSRMVGIVLPSVAEEHMGGVAETVETRFFDKGYATLLGQSLGQADRERDVVRSLLDRRVDGLVLCPAPRLAGFYDLMEMIRDAGVPLVLVDRYPASAPGMNIPYVVTDDRTGGYEVARHLLELGHRDILFLAGPAGASSAEERKEGFRRAMLEAGREDTDPLIFSAGFDMEGGRKAVLQAMQERSRFTAIMAVNDAVAVGAAQVLLSQGLRIPSDVSVAGYGDLVLGRAFQTPLTTVHQPRVQLAEAALATMEELFRKGVPPARRLPVQLVRRESTAPLS